MRRMGTALVLLTTTLTFAATGAAATRSSGHAEATQLTIWAGWSAGHELVTFKKVVAEYDQKHPEVTVKVVGGINDNKIVAAIRSGTAPDVVSSFNSYNVGNYCGTGGWSPASIRSSASTRTSPSAGSPRSAASGRTRRVIRSCRRIPRGRGGSGGRRA